MTATTIFPHAAKPLLYQTHMHTPLCHHAVGLPEDYAAVAFERKPERYHRHRPQSDAAGVRSQRAHEAR